MSTESQPTGVTDEETSVTDMTDASGRLDTDALSETDSKLELDQVYEILKNQRRRYVLQYLNEVDDTVSMSDLAEEIAAWENDKDVSRLSSSERKRVYVGLYQCHLPKMDSMGVVSFDKHRGRIERGPNADVFDEYLQTDASDEGAVWHRVHAATAAASAAVLLIAFVVQAMVTAPVVAVAGVLAVAANVGVSVAHFERVRTTTEDEEADAAPSDDDATAT